MTRLRLSALFVATLIVIAAKSSFVDAQSTKQAPPSPPSQSATMAVTIAIPKAQVPLGEKPWVFLTVTNLGGEKITYPHERVYVEGPNGEPAPTYIQRAKTNRLKPGEPGIRLGGYEPPISPEGSFTMKYDLSGYYDFKDPGKYTVYIELFDRLAEKASTKTDTDYWLRSPVATFELLAPTR